MPEILREQRVAIIRNFNRLITRRIGALQEGLLHSPFTLTESRVLYEIAQRNTSTASDLAKDLGLDTGYLSRILSSLEQKSLIGRTRSSQDARQQIINLTDEGFKAFELLNRRSNEEVSELLNELSERDQERLITAMETIMGLLERKPLKYSEPYFLRQHAPGDMGLIVYKHGLLYADEYGWDEHFEALVSQIVADFINNFKPSKERCWIAEMDGEVVGSIFLVQHTETTAKLRLLLVDPKARGIGLGTRLVDECIKFARRAKYDKISLWTNSILTDARSIYARTGFTLVAEEKHHSFGHDLIGETWELEL